MKSIVSVTSSYHQNKDCYALSTAVPCAEIVVFLGLKVFNSENNSPCMPAKEMRSCREPIIENNRFPKL